MFLTFILLSAISALLALFIANRRRKLSVFSKMGVNGPVPNILFGNLHELAKKKTFEAYYNWTQAFGKTYGIYEGSSPVLVTSDTNILREVYLTKFSHFYARRLFPIQPDPDTGASKDVHILFSRGQRWRRLRTIISPTFSNIKIKQMFPLVNGCIDRAIGGVFAAKAKTGEEFDIHLMIQSMTLDVIATCAFGLSTAAQQCVADPALHRCRRLFEDFAKKRPLVMVLGALFPEFRSLWLKVSRFQAWCTYDDMDWLYAFLSDVIKERRLQLGMTGGKPARVDLLQLLIDAELGAKTVSTRKSAACSDTVDKDEHLKAASGYRPLSSEQTATPGCVTSANSVTDKPLGRTTSMTSKLTMDEVIANSIIFFVGGYETTSNLISYVIHEMAMHPHSQAKLQLELDCALSMEPDGFTYDVISQLPYLDMVVREALRMYPTGVLFTGRICMNDTDLCGIRIPKGMTIQPDVWSLHRNAEHWGERPNEFDPDRFLPEKVASREPMVYLPFGLGPRNCVGMRFALLESKLAIARLLSSFTVEATPRTRLELVDGAAVSPKNGIIIKLVDRR